MTGTTPFRPAARVADLGVSEILRISARAAALAKALARIARAVASLRPAALAV